MFGCKEGPFSDPALSILDMTIDETIVKLNQRLQSPFSHPTFQRHCHSQNKAVFQWVQLNYIGLSPLHKCIHTFPVCLLVDKT